MTRPKDIPQPSVEWAKGMLTATAITPVDRGITHATVDISSGSINVEGTQDDPSVITQIKIKAFTEAGARRKLQRLQKRLSVEASSDKVSVKDRGSRIKTRALHVATRFTMPPSHPTPELGIFKRSRLDVKLQVPQESIVFELATPADQIVAKQIAAQEGTNIITTYAPIETTSTLGNIKSRTIMGPITHTNHEGSLDAATDSGNISVTDNTVGKTSARSDTGNMRFVNVDSIHATTFSGRIGIFGTKDAVAMSHNGNISFDNLGGNIVAETTEGDINGRNNEGTIKLKTRSGDITLRGVLFRGLENVLRTNFGDVLVETVNNSLHLAAESLVDKFSMSGEDHTPTSSRSGVRTSYSAHIGTYASENQLRISTRTGTMRIHASK